MPFNSTFSFGFGNRHFIVATVTTTTNTVYHYCCCLHFALIKQKQIKLWEFVEMESQVATIYGQQKGWAHLESFTVLPLQNLELKNQNLPKKEEALPTILCFKLLLIM